MNHIIQLNFFFFQAEDGIRDTSVTGVQTCALPIFRYYAGPFANFVRSHGPYILLSMPCIISELVGWLAKSMGDQMIGVRSEERRVGKECRCGGSGYH